MFQSPPVVVHVSDEVHQIVEPLAAERDRYSKAYEELDAWVAAFLNAATRFGSIRLEALRQGRERIARELREGRADA